MYRYIKYYRQKFLKVNPCFLVLGVLSGRWLDGVSVADRAALSKFGAFC